MNAADRFPSTQVADQLDIRWMLVPKWTGPSWTGDTMIVEYGSEWGDTMLWHEITHWLVATPEQRTHPDYAIGRRVDSTDKMVWSSCAPNAVEGEESWDGVYLGFDEGQRQEIISVAALIYYPLAISQITPETIAAAYKIASDFGAFDWRGSSHVFRYNMTEIVELLAPLGLDEDEIRAWPRRFKALCPEMSDVRLTPYRKPTTVDS